MSVVATLAPNVSASSADANAVLVRPPCALRSYAFAAALPMEKIAGACCPSSSPPPVRAAALAVFRAASSSRLFSALIASTSSLGTTNGLRDLVAVALCAASKSIAMILQENGWSERGITPDGKAYVFARSRVQTEFAGACFAPDGSTMFVNFYAPTMTLAIRGPWHKVRG